MCALSYLVDGAEFLRNAGGVGSDDWVSIEPPPARILLLAVHECVQIVVAAADGVLQRVHRVVQQLPVEECHAHYVRARWQHSLVQCRERLHGVLVEAVGGGHVIEAGVAVADVVADEREVRKDGVVQLLIAPHRVHELGQSMDRGKCQLARKATDEHE